MTGAALLERFHALGVLPSHWRPVLSYDLARELKIQFLMRRHGVGENAESYSEAIDLCACYLAEMEARMREDFSVCDAGL